MPKRFAFDRFRKPIKKRVGEQFTRNMRRAKQFKRLLKKKK